MRQICPAIGWTAIYEDDKGSTPLPLACWALNDVGEVVGLVPDNGGLVEAPSKENFKQYDYDTEGLTVDFALMKQLDDE